MSAIVIIHRPDDSGYEAGQLAEALRARFPGTEVTLTSGDGEAGLPVAGPGAPPPPVYLVVIGERWLTAVNPDGRRWLDAPEDPLRRQLAGILRPYLWVVPVLVQGVSVPAEEELPGELQRLTWRNRLTLGDTSWGQDLQRLCEALTEFLRHPPLLAYLGAARWREQDA